MGFLYHLRYTFISLHIYLGNFLRNINIGQKKCKLCTYLLALALWFYSTVDKNLEKLRMITRFFVPVLHRFCSIFAILVPGTLCWHETFSDIYVLTFQMIQKTFLQLHFLKMCHLIMSPNIQVLTKF